MNQFITTLIFSLLMLTCSCQNLTEVTTVVKPQSSEDSGKLMELKTTLEQRAKKMNFRKTTIEIDDPKSTLTLTTEVDLETQTGLSRYRSMFKSNTLELWETYRVNDPEISEALLAMPEIDRFLDFRQFELGYLPLEMLGFCDDESLLQAIADSLSIKLSNIPNLKLMWTYEMDRLYGGEKGYQLFLINTTGLSEAKVNDTHITEATAEPDSYSMEPQILFSMNKEGAKIWRELTREAANNENRSIAIVINDKVYSVPRVMSEISGGKCAISGAFSLIKADEIATAISLGRLPFPIEILEEKILKD
ncbi:MAG: hypothetical protein DWQ02_10865 [Bacteroidetes bacterium]|nr:MAG: hypothetical protein DWQ02_10865 [Bacteroidota bacterium]